MHPEVCLRASCPLKFTSDCFLVWHPEAPAQRQVGLGLIFLKEPSNPVAGHDMELFGGPGLVPLACRAPCGLQTVPSRPEFWGLECPQIIFPLRRKTGGRELPVWTRGSSASEAKAVRNKSPCQLLWVIGHEGDQRGCCGSQAAREMAPEHHAAASRCSAAPPQSLWGWPSSVGITHGIWLLLLVGIWGKLLDATSRPSRALLVLLGRKSGNELLRETRMSKLTTAC